MQGEEILLNETRTTKKEATFFSSLINLCNTILGAGLLGMPFAFAKTGLVYGALLVILGGLASAFGLHLLSECCKELDREEEFQSSYFSIAQRTYPSATILIDAAIIIKCFGVGISYMIIVRDLFPVAVENIFTLSKESILVQNWFWLTIITIVIISPLCFFKKLDHLKHSSVLALLSVGLLLCIVIYFYLNLSFTNFEVSKLKLWVFQVENYKAVTIFVFGFTCHQNLCPIYNELATKAHRRINSVIVVSITICFWLYMIVGLLGYMTFGSDVKANIITSYPPKDVLVNIGRVALAILVTLSFPLQCFPARASINNIILWFFPRLQFELLRFVLITVSVLAISYTVAFFNPGLDLMFSIVGATGSTTICYILPGSFYFKMFVYRPSIKRIFAVALAILGCILMVVSLVFIFLDRFYFAAQRAKNDTVDMLMQNLYK